MDGKPDDVSDLEADFPAWNFFARWTPVNSGPDARTLWAFPLEGGAALSAPDADGLRRLIREAGG